MRARGHVFVWHKQVANWVTNGKFTPEQLAEILRKHILTVGGRYRGKIYAWDVVNEAILEDGSLRDSVWYNQPGIGRKGTSYIEQSFRWAREADPKALLFYNDYSAEAVNAKSDAIFNMAKDFKARGVPIDGIGLQAHFTAQSIQKMTSIDANVKRITDLGLQVQITELDVRLKLDSSGKVSDAELAEQAKVYGALAAICLKYPLCTAIQIWGFTDKYSWIPRANPGFGAALPLDSSYQAKPAYNALCDALLAAPAVVRPALPAAPK
jgi:endo-1,4-beta-xylanase